MESEENQGEEELIQPIQAIICSEDKIHGEINKTEFAKGKERLPQDEWNEESTSEDDNTSDESSGELTNQSHRNTRDIEDEIEEMQNEIDGKCMQSNLPPQGFEKNNKGRRIIESPITRSQKEKVTNNSLNPSQ